MDTLGIEKKDVEKAIIEGMKWKEKIGEKWHAKMAGVELVFVKKQEVIFVITVYES